MTLDSDPESEFASAKHKKLIVAAGVLFALAAVGGGIAWWRLSRPGPFGIESRLPWTTSNVIGSPDPADPFAVERIFPSLTFNKPVDITLFPGNKRVVVAQQEGRLVSFRNDNTAARADLLLDLTLAVGVKKTANYRGVEVLGLTFDPNYNENHFCYVCYRIVFPPKRALEYAKHYPQNETASRLSRFTVSGNDPPTIDPTTESILLTWPGGGHNGGCIKFGPDSNLYLSTGDNGDASPPDPFEIGQEVDDLRGKILRIDVDVHHVSSAATLPYSIPADNPFRDTHHACGEVFAFGLRNPWRFSFDSKTGELWAGEQGWELWESILHVTNGANFGWSIDEGPQPVFPGRKLGPTPITPPEFSLPHTDAASITGGYVYHGKRLPELENQYLFGDSETRCLFAAPFDPNPPSSGARLGKYRTIARTSLQMIAFGEDENGELYIVDFEGGGIWRIVKNPAAGAVQKFPRKLSETGLFSDAATQQPNAGVVPYHVNAPQWVDGSVSQRFIAVPGGGVVTDNAGGKRVFPANTVLVRTLSLARVAGDASTRRKIETQLLHFDGQWWHGYSYQWNNDETDATLVEESGRDVDIPINDPAVPGTKHKQTWHFNSRTQCMTCHTKWSGHAIGFTELELDRTEQYQTARNGPVMDNQLRSLRHIGLIPEPKPPEEPKDGGSAPEPPAPVVLVDPYDEDPAHTLEDRARSYLHINCSVCHRKGGGGAALFDLRRDLTFLEMHVVSDPMLATFDLPDSQLVCPGDPSRSVLYYRMATTGAGRMPQLGSRTIDEKGLALIAKWIVSLHGKAGAARLSEEARHAHDRQGGALQKLQVGATGAIATAAADELLKTPDGALLTLTALQDGRIPSSLRPLVIERAMQSPAGESVRDLFVRFLPEGGSTLPKIGSKPSPATIAKLLAIPGDAARGRRIFFEFAGGLCSKCHVIARQGSDFGPDLSQIGAKYTKAEILDNILDPSKTLTQGFETYIITTKTGERYTGLVKSKTELETVLKDALGKLTITRAEDIASTVMDTRSAMPEGMISDLEFQQAADLLEFLVTKK